MSAHFIGRSVLVVPAGNTWIGAPLSPARIQLTNADSVLLLLCDLVADPFDADNDEFEQADTTKEDYIHIRIQQRNGRKTLTTLQGLSPRES